VKLSFIGKANDEDVGFAVANGFSGIEILYHNFFSEKDEQGREEQKALMKRNALEVCAIGLWRINTIDPDSQKRKENIAAIKRFIDHAEFLECPVAYTGAGLFKEGDDEANLKEFLEVFPEIVDYAERKGIKVALYMGHHPNFVNNTEIWDRVSEAIPKLGMKLDPVGIIRNMKADYLDVLKRYGHKVYHFHIKDILRLGDFEIEPTVGMGEIEWGKIFGILYHYRYDGYISIEPHGPDWGKPENRYLGLKLSKRFVDTFILPRTEE